ncbi:MAG TPA: LPS export ABC transporter periplasmic protein LptC [Chitinophagaceae bacterium]|nr:LPS export ABC transporter periplasmic protein LptC [Chitinophagaceae bacterium]
MAAFLWGCLFFISCENDINKIKELANRPVNVEVMDSVNSYISQGGKIKARLSSVYLLRTQDTVPRVEFPKHLHVEFYDDSARLESFLDAQYGKYYEGRNQVFLRDSVRVYNIKGDTLWTNELWWDQLQRKFYTDKDFRVWQHDKYIIGSGLEAGQDLKWYKMKNINNSYLNVPANNFPQ